MPERRAKRFDRKRVRGVACRDKGRPDPAGGNCAPEWAGDYLSHQTYAVTSCRRYTQVTGQKPNI